MGNGWSKELKDLTRKSAGPGAMVKSLGGDFGFISSLNPISIVGVKSGSGMPLPSENEIARFADVEEMLEAGWAID